MKIAIQLAITVVFIIGQTLGQGGSSCYATTPNPYLYFTIWTSYNTVKNVNTDPIDVPGCSPVQIWLFSRHGMRYPMNDSPDDLELQDMYDQLPALRDAVIENHNSGRGNMCDADLENLRQWTIDIPFGQEENLSPAGEDEMNNLGQRYKARLPNLLDRPYQDGDYVFRFTTASRTEKSCNHFVRGVWSKAVDDSITYPDPILPHDPLIRYYKLCTKWLVEVDNNAGTVEMKKFIKGFEMSMTARLVSSRLGFTSSLSIKFSSAHAHIHKMCAYDKGLDFNSTSPWCAALSETDFLVLEYIRDLKHYYKDGYGFDIDWMQACNPIVDVFNYFNSIVTGETSLPCGIFYFTTDHAFGKLLSRLSLYRDAILPTADNYAIQADRQWRTSKIQNMGSNAALVLHRCQLNTFKVQLYVNEFLLRIPGCSEDACSFEEFKSILKPIIDTCDFDAICENV